MFDKDNSGFSRLEKNLLIILHSNPRSIKEMKISRNLVTNKENYYFAPQLYCSCVCAKAVQFFCIECTAKPPRKNKFNVFCNSSTLVQYSWQAGVRLGTCCCALSANWRSDLVLLAGPGFAPLQRDGSAVRPPPREAKDTQVQSFKLSPTEASAAHTQVEL